MEEKYYKRLPKTIYFGYLDGLCSSVGKDAILSKEKLFSKVADFYKYVYD